MNIRWSSFQVVLVGLAVSIVFFVLVNRADAQENPGDLQLHPNANLEIVHRGTTEPSDTFHLVSTTFTNNDYFEAWGCEDGDDPIAQGLTLTLGTGGCRSSTDVVSVVIPPFSSSGGDARLGLGSKEREHKKPKTHYTLKMPVTATDPSTGETESAWLDASITLLPTPAFTCGEWTFDVEVSKVDLSALNTFEVVVTIGQGDDSGCNDHFLATHTDSGDGGVSGGGDRGGGSNGDGDSRQD
jgi:hypothetical protein